jgi:hypothetical protein
MSVRWPMTIVGLVVFLSAPDLALGALCFNWTGLPEAASLSVNTLAAPPGPVPLVGEAQGVCGLGQPAAPVQGTAIVDANGAARVGLKLLADRPGCSGGQAEIVLPAPFTSGSGQLRLPEGSIANVALTLDPTGQACQPRVPRVTACVPNLDPTALCLLQNRFLITATAAQGAQLVPGQAKRDSSEVGYFTFSPTTNVELVVKVLDSRAVNNFFWVVVTPLANVAYTLTVSDTMTGRIKTYTNPIGAQSSTIVDTGAFSPNP